MRPDLNTSSSLCSSSDYLELFALVQDAQFHVDSLNISFSVPPDVTPVSGNWTYTTAIPDSTLVRSIGIECPLQICAASVSNVYGQLSRIVLYLILLFAISSAAAPVRTLRHMAGVLALAIFIATLCYTLAVVSTAGVFVDLNQMPNYVIMFTAAVATTATLLNFCEIDNFWPMIRKTPALSHLFWPSYILGISLMTAFFIALILGPTAYNRKLPAVMLRSGDDYLIATPCYTTNGKTSFWDPTFHPSIRQISSMSTIGPDLGSIQHHTARQMSDIYNNAKYPIQIGYISFTWVAGWGAVIMTYNGFLIWNRMFPLDENGTARRYFCFMRFWTSIIPLTALAFVIMLEVGIRTHNIPVASKGNEFDQWGIFLIFILSVLGVLLYDQGRKTLESLELDELAEAALEQFAEQDPERQTRAVNMLDYIRLINDRDVAANSAPEGSSDVHSRQLPDPNDGDGEAPTRASNAFADGTPGPSGYTRVTCETVHSRGSSSSSISLENGTPGPSGYTRLRRTDSSSSTE